MDLLGFLKLKIGAFSSWTTEYGFLTWNVEFPLFPLFPASWILIKHILDLFHVFYPFVFFAVFYRISSALFQFTYFLFSCVLSEVQKSQCLLHINCVFFFSVGSFYISLVMLIVSFSHDLISFSFLNFSLWPYILVLPLDSHPSHPDSLLLQVYSHLQIFALTDLYWKQVECFHLTTRNMHVLLLYFLQVFI